MYTFNILSIESAHKECYRFIIKNQLLTLHILKILCILLDKILMMTTVACITFIQTDRSFSFRVVKVSFKYIFKAQAFGEISGSVV